MKKSLIILPTIALNLFFMGCKPPTVDPPVCNSGPLPLTPPDNYDLMGTWSTACMVGVDEDVIHELEVFANTASLKIKLYPKGLNCNLVNPTKEFTLEASYTRTSTSQGDLITPMITGCGTLGCYNGLKINDTASIEIKLVGDDLITTDPALTYKSVKKYEIENLDYRGCI